MKLTTALLYATTYDGFYEWDITSDSGTLVPTGVRAVFWGASNPSGFWAGAHLAFSPFRTFCRWISGWMVAR